MNAIISKEPMGVSSVGEWVKLGERELSEGQSTYNTFCDFTDVYEAISVIHITYLWCRENSGISCSSSTNTYSEDFTAYFYCFANYSTSGAFNFYLTKHFWKHQFYTYSLSPNLSQSAWSPKPNAGSFHQSIWGSIYPDTLYQYSQYNQMEVTGTQTIYGLKIS